MEFMKKLMAGILLSTLLLSTTAMSFAAENGNLEKKAILASKIVAATEIKAAEIIKLDIKDLGNATVEFIEIKDDAIKSLGEDIVVLGINEDQVMELPSFKEYMKEMKDELKDINKTDLKALEKLYDEAVALEEDKKFDTSAKKWDDFYKILGKYFKNLNMEIISSSKALTIDMVDLEKAHIVK